MEGQEQDAAAVSGDDEELLRRFLSGELDTEAFDALEERLDVEPALQRRLGSLAREQQQQELSATTAIDHTTRFSGRGVVKRRKRDVSTEPLEVGEVIGEGGMGVVHLGRQHTVGRDVAIKTVKSKDIPSISLLEEAWVTGQLEHPNIVPIHDIATSDDGRAQVVLKHIEGVSWSQLVNKPEQVRRRFHVEDPLEWHLRVLIQVCQALRFAHSRHIVHRDVKPANVMIGRFDEVYLLDWGLAISTQPSDRLPTLQTSYGIAGSPAYMAPEQFEAVPMRVGTQTDVYLLGATLYELVTGNPPHAGKTLDEIRQDIEARRELELPKETPRELAAIIRRATSFAIEGRYNSVLEMREAIDAFLQHRGSQALAKEADVRAGVTRARQTSRDDAGAARSFAAAVFGYRMAIRAWSGNEHAKKNLAELVQEMVERLLELRVPRDAQRALAVLEDPDPALVAKVEEGLAKEDRERQKLKRLVRDEDRRVGYRTRRLFVVILGTTWMGLWTAIAANPPASPIPLLVGLVALFIPCTVAVLYFRREMLAVRLNRYITLIIGALFAAMFLWLTGAALLQLPMTTVITTILVLWCMATASAAPTVEPRILPTSVAYGVGFLVAAADPSLLPYAVGGSTLVQNINMLAINIAIANRPSRTSDPPPSRD